MSELPETRLQRTRPIFWRRLLGPSSATLRELHEIIQLAMG